MRLLFVCSDMGTGGAERHWATLVPALRARGHDARVLCLVEEGALYADLVAAGVPASCARMRRRSDPRGLRRALAHARPAPDAVISRGVNGLLVGEAIARLARAPHVVNEHTPLTADGELLPPRRHQRVLTRLVAPWVRSVIAVTRRQVEPLARRGFRRGRIEVVANGVFAERVRPVAGREATRAALGLLEGELAALCVARLRPEKRVEVFLRAARDARRVDPRVRAFVAGEGSERPRLEAPASEAGALLLGVRADVPDLMAAADAVCLTSDSEALPMSVLEGMALARPVIATDVGGAEDEIEHGRTGFLVPPGDSRAVASALLALANDSARARAMGELARDRQRERFDGEAMVDAYLRIIERLVRGSSGRAAAP